MDRRHFLSQELPRLFRSGLRNGIRAFMPPMISDDLPSRLRMRVGCPPVLCSIPLIVHDQIMDELELAPSLSLRWEPVQDNEPEQSPVYFCPLEEALATAYKGQNITLIGLVHHPGSAGSSTACCSSLSWLKQNHAKMLLFLEAYGSAAAWCNRNPAPAAQIAAPLLKRTISELENEIECSPIFLISAFEARPYVYETSVKMEAANPGISGFIQENAAFFYTGNG